MIPIVGYIVTTLLDFQNVRYVTVA